MTDENDGLIVDGVGRPEEEIQLADHQETTTCKSSAGTKLEHTNIVELARARREREKEMKLFTRKERTVIQKVPETIRQNEEYIKNFKPKELSIGPIHAGDSVLYNKELKLKLAACYIDETCRSDDELYEEIELGLEEIKKSFDEEITNTYSHEELIDLLFLDGCAMLGFIHSYVNKKLHMFHISNKKAALIQQDLFLLENQIPFTVLKVLMGFGRRRKIEKNLIKDFCRFIALTSTFPRDRTEFIVMDLVHKDPLHFLDLFRKVLLFKASHILSGCMKYIRFRQSKKKSGHIKYSFRNVQELKKVGIEFKPSDSLRAISFHSPFFTRAKLMLPTLVVDNSTENMLFNLVIFEMCLSEYHQNREPWITSYVNLLDLLVDNDQDVKDLRAADILQNCLGSNVSDLRVANLINGVGSKCFAPRKDTYEDVKNKIEKHCKTIFRRKCSLWMTQFSHTHFSSPWTFLALVAATTVLALTAVQAYYAALPYH